MKSSQSEERERGFEMIRVPDLMTDPSYLRELSGGKLYPDSVYFSTLDLNEEYGDSFLARGIQEIVTSIDAVDRYKYADASATYNVFQSYLVALTNLKDYLLPNTEGMFSEKWMSLALEFQRKCEEIFLKYVKEEYILTFLPMVPKQLEYTAGKLREVRGMGAAELADFQNLFSLIALGFIGKLKLLSFYLSLSIMRNSSIDPGLVLAQDRERLGLRAAPESPGSPEFGGTAARTPGELSGSEFEHEYGAAPRKRETSSESGCHEPSYLRGQLEGAPSQGGNRGEGEAKAKGARVRRRAPCERPRPGARQGARASSRPRRRSSRIS